MAPHIKSAPVEETLSLQKNSTQNNNLSGKLITDYSYAHDVKWATAITVAIFHLFGLYGLYLAFTSAKWQTTLFAYILVRAASISLSTGAHRYWAHKSFKAKWPLKLFLVIFHSMSYQLSIWDFARYHRAHHKFNETDADPINPARNFFFAQLGWLLVKKHPLAIEKRRTIYYDDLLNDPFVTYQHKYYLLAVLLFHVTIPTLIPMYFWGETLKNAFFSTWLRWLYITTAAGILNAITHRYGKRPYDRHTFASENLLGSFFSGGEGYHNYHHAFPYDYKASEAPDAWFNESASFINLMARIGWAYDLKSAKPEMIKSRVLRTGDGSHELWGHEYQMKLSKFKTKIDYSQDNGDVKEIWGWGEPDETEEVKSLVTQTDYAKDS